MKVIYTDVVPFYADQVIDRIETFKQSYPQIKLTLPTGAWSAYEKKDIAVEKDDYLDVGGISLMAVEDGTMMRVACRQEPHLMEFFTKLIEHLEKIYLTNVKI